MLFVYFLNNFEMVSVIIIIIIIIIIITEQLRSEKIKIRMIQKAFGNS